MPGCLVKLSPLDTVSGARVDVRASAFGRREDAAVNGMGGQLWEPCLKQGPGIGMTLWNGDFQAAIAPGTATLPINLATLIKTYPDSEKRYWPGAPVEIYIGDAGTAWPWPLLFKGIVTSISGTFPNLTLNAEVDFTPFNKDVLTSAYAGTGGAEGGADTKNRAKPLILGHAMNVEPVLINAVDSVYQFSSYGPIEGVTKLYERGSDFGASAGDYGSYAALVAATIEPGKWATCLAQGMVRLGAPQAGVITGDVRGHVVGGSTPRLTGAVVQALADLAGVSSGAIDSATLSALDTAAPYPINIVLTQSETWLDLARTLILHCNWQAGVSNTGTFFASRIDLTASEALTLHAQGRALPQVLLSEELDVSPPYAKTTMGAARSWRVHTPDEIAFWAEIVYMGRYSDTETYREGNVVNLIDGSEWVYINPEPSAGNPPPIWPATENAWWSNMTPPSDIVGAQVAIRTAAVRNPRDVDNVPRHMLIGTTDGGGVPSISVARHDWDYPNGSEDVVRVPGTITGSLVPNAEYWVYFDDSSLADLNPVYAAASAPDDGENSSSHPYRHPLGKIRVPAIGEGPTHGGAIPGYGYQVLADVAEEVATNFNARNDRNGSPILLPVLLLAGEVVDHTINTNGSADISFEWAWLGAEADIDGFEVMTYTSTTSTPYTPDSAPLAQRIDIVGPDRRALILFGVDPTRYYTFAVRGYRIVDPDIDLDQRIYSPWVKSLLAAENPYRPSANVAWTGDITGTINGVPATTIATATANFNARNDRNGSAIAAPVVLNDGSAVDHTINADASADVSFEWTWSGSNNDIDGWEVVVVQRASSAPYTIGSSPAIEMLYPLPPDRRALIHPGQNPVSWYTFYVRAFRIVDQDVAAGGRINSAWVKSSLAGENPYQPASSVAFAGNITGTVNGLAASTVSTAAQNFNARNDRDGSPIAAATFLTNGDAVDHTINADASADLSIEWQWSGSNNDIDGWQVLVYSSASGTAYVPGSSPASESVAQIPADKRAIILPGVNPTNYYTVAVRPYRAVDTDIAASGIIVGPWAKPTLAAENPYRPAANAAFAGNVTGTVNGTSAANIATWAATANAGLLPSGFVRPGMVDTAAIRNQALIAAGYAEEGATIFFNPSEDYHMPMVASLNISGTRVVVDLWVAWNLVLTNPYQGQEPSVTVRGWMQSTSGGAYSYSNPTLLTARWDAPAASGTFYTQRTLSTFQFVFPSPSPGFYRFGYRFSVGSGNGFAVWPYRYLKANDLRATE